MSKYSLRTKMNILKSAETALFMAASVDFSFVEANTHTHLPLVSRLAEPTELLTTNTHQKKDPPVKSDGRVLSQRRRPPTLPHCIAVPSAQAGLTSLFGMGRGGTPLQ